MNDLLLSTIKPEPAPGAAPASSSKKGRSAAREDQASFRRDLDRTIEDGPRRGRGNRSRGSEKAAGGNGAQKDADPARTSGKPRGKETGEGAETTAVNGARNRQSAGTDQAAAPQGVATDAGVIPGDGDIVSDDPLLDPEGLLVMTDAAGSPEEAAAETDALPDETPFQSIDDILGEDGTSGEVGTSGAGGTSGEDGLPGEEAIVGASAPGASTEETDAEATAVPGTPAAAAAPDASETAKGATEVSIDPDRRKAAARAPATPPAAADAQDGGDKPDKGAPAARPAPAFELKSERALVAHNIFKAHAAGRKGQPGADTAAIVDRLGAGQMLDAAAAGLRGHGPAGPAVTLRITPVSADSRLTAVPVNTLAFHVARSVDKGINRFEIRLDPPELGRIDVRLEVDGDSKVRVHLTVQRAEALDFLQRDARALERALDSAGLNTDGESVSFSLDPGGRGAGNDAGASFGDDDRLRPSMLDDADEPEILPTMTHYISNTAVDIRV